MNAEKHLGRVQNAVLAELRQAGGPLTTSQLLDRLQAAGVVRPGFRPTRLSNVRMAANALVLRGLLRTWGEPDPRRPKAGMLAVWDLLRREEAEAVAG